MSPSVSAEASPCLSLSFPRTVKADEVVAFWSGVSAALTVPRGSIYRPAIVAEVMAHDGRLHHLVHGSASVLPVVQQQLSAQLPGVRWETADGPVLGVDEALELRLSSAQRALRMDRAAEVSAAVLSALGAAAPDETLVLQWVLGGSSPQRAVHRGTPETVPLGDVRHEAGEVVFEVRHKASEPALAGVCRIGVRAQSRGRRSLLLRGVLGALRGSDSPGVRTVVRSLPSGLVCRRLERRTVPMLWPTSYNGAELAARLAWPILGPQVRGLALGGSRLLVPSQALSTNASDGAVLAETTFPGDVQPLVLRDQDRLEHLHIVGPTGVGKSTLLARLALQDIAAGHGVILIDPKGDLVDDVLDRLPAERLHDVILIDPADTERPVGYNPLAQGARSLDLVGDAITSVFNGLFSQYWGPRTDDTLRSSVLTLGRVTPSPAEAYTLCEVTALLVDKAFRKRLTAGLNDPIALGPFWAVYESMRDADRAQAISPLLNKLRAFLLRSSLRDILGQSAPGWSVEEVMSKRQILLVQLRSGVIGEESAQLLGSLLVARIWQATLARASLPREARSPVMVHLDEFHTLIHLPTSMGDLLATARGLGVGLTVAHQHFGQLTPELRHDVLANARSRIVFQVGIEDAQLLARGLPELTADDLRGLPSREVVLSLVANAEVHPAVTGRTLPLGPSLGTAQAARDYSRLTYGVPRTEVEAALLLRRAVDQSGPKGRSRGNARGGPQIGEVPDGEAS